MDRYTAAPVFAYGSTPTWSRDVLLREIQARGWSARAAECEGYPAIEVRDGGPGWLLVKSRFEAIAGGFIKDE